MSVETEKSQAKLRKELSQTFRSLKQSRNFRIYFIGQIVSLSGTWMQSVALSWLIYRMTHSPVALAQVESANLLPMMLFGLVGGSVADKYSRKKVLLVTQCLAMLQAIVLAILTLTHQLQVWQAIFLAFWVGTCSAFEVPSRQALLVDLVDRDNLVNAISLNSSLFQGARTVGPALAGAIVAASSEGVCFLLNAISFLAAILAISLLKVPKRLELSHKESQNVTEALKFVWKEPSVRRVLLLATCLSLFGLQFTVLLPVFASDILHGDVKTLAALRAVAGIGALIAALNLAHRGSAEFLRTAVGVACVVFSISLIVFCFSTNLVLSLALASICGMAMTTQMSGGHSLFQLAVTDRLRGRVMSIYMTVMLGIAPLGSYVVGLAASKYGAPPTVATCGIICLCAGLLYLLSVRGEKARNSKVSSQELPQSGAPVTQENSASLSQ
ncbi:MAG TPA: MFS transporter [Drouetiella sp.]